MSDSEDVDVHHDFAHGHEVRSTAPMATFLEHVEAIPEFVTYKTALRESLALRPGDVVLDVGCGIGTHATRIAAEHDGPVWGVDRGPMLAEARERAGARDDVRWLEGEATALPLPDRSVDACLIERVLKYVPEPRAVLSEIVRVLRPHGRVAIFELDYDSLTLPGDPRVADAAHSLLCDSVAHQRMGRQLPSLLSDAGLVDTVSRAFAFVAPWPVHDRIVRTPVRMAVENGRLDRSSTLAWLAEQEEPGAMTSIHVGVLARARRPADLP